MFVSCIEEPDKASIIQTYDPECPISPQELRKVTFSHKDFSVNEKIGTVVLNRLVAERFSEIMHIAYDIGYPINQAILLEEFDWDDNASMEANNTSGFNYRMIAGTDKLSNHSYGLAIDVNPLMNPYFASDNQWYPNNGLGYIDRDTDKIGMFSKTHIITQAFLERGFTWGGDWDRPDYHHFEFTV